MNTALRITMCWCLVCLWPFCALAGVIDNPVLEKAALESLDQSGPLTVELLGQVEILWLSPGESVDLSGIGTMKNLRVLRIFDASLAHVSELSALPQLIELTLSGCELGKLPDLRAFPKLRYLRADRNRLAGLEGVFIGPALRWADFSGNPGVTDAMASAWRGNRSSLTVHSEKEAVLTKEEKALTQFLSNIHLRPRADDDPPFFPELPADLVPYWNSGKVTPGSQVFADAVALVAEFAAFRYRYYPPGALLDPRDPVVITLTRYFKIPSDPFGAIDFARHVAKCQPQKLFPSGLLDCALQRCQEAEAWSVERDKDLPKAPTIAITDTGI